MNETSRTEFPVFGISSVKFPSMSVVVPIFVSFTRTFAPGIVSFVVLLITFPETTILWSKSFASKSDALKMLSINPTEKIMKGLIPIVLTFAINLNKNIIIRIFKMVIILFNGERLNE